LLLHGQNSWLRLARCSYSFESSVSLCRIAMKKPSQVGMVFSYRNCGECAYQKSGMANVGSGPDESRGRIHCACPASNKPRPTRLVGLRRHPLTTTIEVLPASAW